MAAGKLRLFTTFEDKAPAAANGSKQALSGDGAHQQREQLARLAMGSSKWGALFAASTAHDMPTTALLLHCIALGYTSSKDRPLLGFDRPASGGGSGGGGGASDGSLAASLAEHLVQGWWCLTSLPGWRWQLQASAAIGAALRCDWRCIAPQLHSRLHDTHTPTIHPTPPHLQSLLESPCFGVPGLCRYIAARSAWMQRQLQLCLEADNCRCQGWPVLLTSSSWHCAAQAGGDGNPHELTMPQRTPAGSCLQAGGGAAGGVEHLVTHHGTAWGQGGPALPRRHCRCRSRCQLLRVLPRRCRPRCCAPS